MLYRVRTLTSNNAEESENSPESPHLGEIKRMRKQRVPGASSFFARAGDEANAQRDQFPSARLLGLMGWEHANSLRYATIIRTTQQAFERN